MNARALLRDVAPGLACTVLWGVAFALGVHSGAVLPFLGGAALVVVVAFAIAARTHEPHASDGAAARRPARVVVDFALGLSAAAVTIAGSYLVYPLLVQLMPRIDVDVRTLAAAIPITPTTVPVVALIATAEELLWRGLLVRGLRPHVGTTVALVVATTLYALAQGAAGIPVLVPLALGLGAVWGLLAVVTRSLRASILAHVAWTLTVYWLHPIAGHAPS